MKDRVKYINAGSSQYLGDFMKDLPENVMLNKVITGCGGTTVALKSKHPYVIAVPFNTLRENKERWAKEYDIELLGVWGSVDESDFANFKGNKFIVVYDSLGKLTKWLSDRVKNHRILIDESHLLLNQASFRTEAIPIVLENYKKYKSFTFMTASPPKQEYQLPELRDIERADIIWSDNVLEDLKIERYKIKRGQLNTTIAGLCYSHLKEEDKFRGNAHVFFNSVKGIIDVIKKLRVNDVGSPNDVSIVCANNTENKEKIFAELNHSWHITNAGQNVKKINLYTSTAFEGSDVYDENGITYIAVNGEQNHTKVNIRGTLPQIAGRIRNQIDRKIRLIYTESTNYRFDTEEEFSKVVKMELSEAEKRVIAINSELIPRYKSLKIEDAKTDNYLLVREYEDGKLIVKPNESAWYSQMANWETLNTTFKVGKYNDKPVVHNYVKHSYTNKEIDNKHSFLFEIVSGDKYSFKELYLQYLKAMEEKDIDLCIRIEGKDRTIKKAYDKLTPKKVKALRYRRQDIIDEMAVMDKTKTSAQKIVRRLDFKVGGVYAKDLIKQNIQTAYNVFRIDKLAKATDIKEWYLVKEQDFIQEVRKNKKVVDLKRLKGYSIISQKVRA